MGDFGSNRAALLIAGFLGRKVMKDMLGRWSVIPVLAVGLCLWTKWKTRQDECRLEQSKLEEVRRKTRQQLHVLSKKAMAPMARVPIPSLPLLSSSSSSSPSSTPCSSVGQSQQQQRRPGDRLGGVPSPAASNSAASKSAAACRGEHISPSAANGSGGNSSSGWGQPKDALASELWAWLGGVGVGRVCGADRSRRSRGAGGGGGGGGNGEGGEWRGAFTNRMGNVPRRNAFKTARGKVYLRSASRRRAGGGGGGREPPSAGLLESVREEDEGSIAI